MKDRNATKTLGVTSSTKSRNDYKLQDNTTVQMEIRQASSVKYNF